MLSALCVKTLETAPIIQALAQRRGWMLVRDTMPGAHEHRGGHPRRETGAADWQQIWHCEPDERFGGGCVDALCQHAVDAWREGRTPENDATSYLEILAIEEQIYESAATGSRISRERD